jgi:hypothetical protein
MEGFNYAFDFHLKDGELVGASAGREEMAVGGMLERIRSELGVPPHILNHYITHSSLTEAHRERVRGLTDVLSTYGPGTPSLKSGLFSYLGGLARRISLLSR